MMQSIRHDYFFFNHILRHIYDEILAYRFHIVLKHRVNRCTITLTGATHQTEFASSLPLVCSQIPAVVPVSVARLLHDLLCWKCTDVMDMGKLCFDPAR
jgi:hypothetical protein